MCGVLVHNCVQLCVYFCILRPESRAARHTLKGDIRTNGTMRPLAVLDGATRWFVGNNRLGFTWEGGVDAQLWCQNKRKVTL